MKWHLIGLGILVLAGMLVAQEGKSELQRELETAIMAPCCYGGPVSDHDSPAASQIKEQLASLIDEGKTKTEILDMYVAIYGEQILSSPRAKGFNLMAYVMPPIILLVGGLILVYVLNHLKAPETSQQEGKKEKYSQAFFNRLEKEMKELDI